MGGGADCFRQNRISGKKPAEKFAIRRGRGERARAELRRSDPRGREAGAAMMSIKPGTGLGWVAYLRCRGDGCDQAREFRGVTLDAVHQGIEESGWQKHPSICPQCRGAAAEEGQG